MATGISLHIGLNSVDPTHYQGWDGQLKACEADAKDMLTLATSRGFKGSLMLTKAATAEAVTASIAAAAKQLTSGDIFFLTYSGHGGQVPDKSREEKDGQDETWVLYNRELIDDELFTLWGAFKKGVRIVVLSDSCHSGSVTKRLPREAARQLPEAAQFGESPTASFRAMPPETVDKTYKANKKLYDGLQKANPKGDKVAVKSSILLISGCQDSQLSADGDRNGLFTANLLKAWNKGKFTGSYRLFHRRIEDRMPPWQTPNLSIVGAANTAFVAETPFTI